jgi:hypothetical protein
VDNCGLPQFIKDEMKQFIQDWSKQNTHATTPDCQNGCNSVYDRYKLDNADGNNCTRSEGSVFR